MESTVANDTSVCWLGSYLIRSKLLDDFVWTYNLRHCSRFVQFEY